MAGHSQNHYSGVIYQSIVPFSINMAAFSRRKSPIYKANSLALSLTTCVVLWTCTFERDSFLTAERRITYAIEHFPWYLFAVSVFSHRYHKYLKYGGSLFSLYLKRFISQITHHLVSVEVFTNFHSGH